MKKIIVAASIEIRPDWQDVVPPPAKPKNWGSDTYEAKLPELREKQQQTLASNYLASDVSAVHIIEPAADSDACLTITPVEFNTRLYDNAVTIIGVETQSVLRHIAWSCMRRGAAAIHGALWNTPHADSIEVVNIYRASGLKDCSGMTCANWMAATAGAAAAAAFNIDANPQAGEQRAAATLAVARLMGLL